VSDKAKVEADALTVQFVTVVLNSNVPTDVFLAPDFFLGVQTISK